MVAASLGRRFSFADLANMLDRLPATLLGPVEELIESGMLVESGDRLAFRHDVTREAVRESVPVSARRALDRQAADVLLGAGAAPVEVAAQIAASAEPGDEQAISILLRAGEALATTDPGVGADLSRRALELAPRDHKLRGPLLAQSAVLLHSAARDDEARAFADTHLRDALPAEQEAEVLLGIAGMFRIPPDARVAAGRQALALPELPAHLRAHHLAALFHNLLVGGRTEEAMAIQAETAEAVQASGDANSAFAFGLAESVTAYLDGRYDDALELTEQAARSGIGTTDWARERLAQEWRCETRAVLDQVDESLRLAADGVAAAQRDRNGWAIRIFEIWRGRQLHQLGRLDDAGAILEGQFRPETGDRFIGALDAAGIVALGRVALHQGNGRLQQRTAQLAKGLLEDSTPNYRRQAAWLLALLAMATGDPAAAHASLCALGEEQRTSILPVFPIDVTDEIPLVRIALAAGDDELAEVAAAQAERRAQLNPGVATIVATAAHVRGLLTSNIEEFERAVDLFATGPRPIVARLRTRGSRRRTRPRWRGRRRDRGVRRCAGPVCGGRRPLGRGPCARPPPRPRGPPTPRRARARRDRLGGDDGIRARRRAPCGPRSHQPRGRRAAVRVPAHRLEPPAKHLRQARHQLAPRSRPDRGRARHHGYGLTDHTYCDPKPVSGSRRANRARLLVHAERRRDQGQARPGPTGRYDAIR